MASDRPDDDAAPRLDGAILRPRSLAQRRTHSFARHPDAATRTALAQELDLIDLRKLRFDGTLDPVGRHDWDLAGHLGATVVQPCVATLAPVTTRVEERVERRFRADLPAVPDAAEIEMPEDDTLEPLPEIIDLDAIMAEALSLALPPYPRAAGVAPVQTQVTEPGGTPMRDEDARPFAGLAKLRGQLAAPRDGADAAPGGDGPDETETETGADTDGGTGSDTGSDTGPSRRG